jgi:hypothetical protein
MPNVDTHTAAFDHPIRHNLAIETESRLRDLYPVQFSAIAGRIHPSRPHAVPLHRPPSTPELSPRGSGLIDTRDGRLPGS